MPRYSIITPTILRPSLVRACKSVDEQTCADWEHLVIVDDPEGDFPEQITHPRRKIFRCDKKHGEWGNQCRRDVWQHATGEYVYYLDDDNYFIAYNVLEYMNQVTADWAIFPIVKIHYGGLWLNLPPKWGEIDSGNMLIRRELGRWLPKEEISKDAYPADGDLAEKLMRQKIPYEVFEQPVLVYGDMIEYGGDVAQRGPAKPPQIFPDVRSVDMKDIDRYPRKS